MATADIEQPSPKAQNNDEESEPKIKKNPWGIPSNPVPETSLSDVMSEQLASDLQAKDDRPEAVAKSACQAVSNEAGAEKLSDEDFAKMVADETDCKDDLVIAQMLQMQFDREYDQALGHQESHMNRGSKVRFQQKVIKPKFFKKCENTTKAFP